MYKALDKRHYLLRLFAGECYFAADAVAAADGKTAVRKAADFPGALADWLFARVGFDG